jgi:hypothetical protein
MSVLSEEASQDRNHCCDCDSGLSFRLLLDLVHRLADTMSIMLDYSAFPLHRGQVLGIIEWTLAVIGDILRVVGADPT